MTVEMKEGKYVQLISHNAGECGTTWNYYVPNKEHRSQEMGKLMTDFL